MSLPAVCILQPASGHIRSDLSGACLSPHPIENPDAPGQSGACAAGTRSAAPRNGGQRAHALLEKIVVQGNRYTRGTLLTNSPPPLNRGEGFMKTKKPPAGVVCNPAGGLVNLGEIL